MALSSKVELCNKAGFMLGDHVRVSNIDNPVSQTEQVFAAVYENDRQELLRDMMPNFAQTRRLVARENITPPFGFKYAYRMPADCVKFLGLGQIQDRAVNETVEGGIIYTDEEYDTGAPLRFVLDFEDVSQMTPDFKQVLSYKLAQSVCLALTQNRALFQIISQQFEDLRKSSMAMSAQENLPKRITKSRILAEKRTRIVDFVEKK